MASSILCAIVAASGSLALEYGVEVTSDADTYSLPASAHFDVHVYKNGKLFSGGCVLVEASYPDAQTPVILNEVYRGTYTFDVELLSLGEKSLTVVVRRDFSRPIAALRALASRIEEKIERFEQRLAGETNPLKARALAFIISAFERVLEKLHARIAGLEEPLAVGVKTITVVPLQGDTTPPAFGEYVPPVVNGHRATSDPLAQVWAEVSDEESGVDTVELYLDGATSPVPMSYDGVRATYTPTEPWAEGGHTVRILATDAAGNEAELEYDFVADRTSPQIDHYEPTKTADATPLIKVIVSDSLAFVNTVTVSIGADSVTVEAGGLQTVTVWLQVTTLLPQFIPHTVSIVADDMVGNVTSETRTLTIDPFAP
jgi:hypothetical protein